MGHRKATIGLLGGDFRQICGLTPGGGPGVNCFTGQTPEPAGARAHDTASTRRSPTGVAWMMRPP